MATCIATSTATKRKTEASVAEVPTLPVVDTSESRSVRYEVCIQKFPRLVEAVRPVVVKFAVNALSKSLISEYNKCQAENPFVQEYDRASVLMSQITPKIKDSDAHFDAFVAILQELNITRLAHELKKAVDPTVKLPLTARRTREDSDSGSTSGAESVDATGFKCPCGQCSLEKYFRDRSNCPGLQKTSIPYLNTSHLSRDERKTLEHQLIADTNRIKRDFKWFSDAVFKALKGTKRPISAIRSTVFSSAEASSSKKIQTLHGDELKTITTISDLKSFLICYEYISFINYGILEALIEKYDECKECQTDLVSYLQKFKDFSRRSIFEVPASVPSSSPASDQVLVVIVIDELWFGAKRSTPDCVFTMNDIKAVQNKIAEVLDLENRFIHLVDVSNGYSKATQSIITTTAEEDQIQLRHYEPYQQALQNGEEDQIRLRHYEAYQQALQNGVSVPIKYLKLLMFGPPRTGKTSLRRRLIGEIIHLIHDQAILNQPSTGTVDAHNVAVKLSEEKMTNLATTISETTWRAVGHGAEKTDLDEEIHLLYQFIIEGSIGLTSTVSDEPQPSVNQSVEDLEIQNNIDSLEILPDNIMISKSKSSDPQEALATNATVMEEQSMMVSHHTDPEPELKEIKRALEAFNTVLKSHASRQQLKVLLEKTILLNMVDTGGQPAFIEMLPMLTIGPALYLIFLRLDQELKQKYKIQYVSEDSEEVTLGESSYTFQEVIFQVLSSIACFRSDTSSTTSVPEKPQITSQQSLAAMLVGTYKDKLEGSRKEVQSKIKQIDRALQEELTEVLDTDLFEADRNLLRYASEDQLMFDVDNMTGGEDEVKKIRKRLEEVIFQDFNKVPIPASWLMFGLFLRRMGKHLVSLSHCEEIGRRFHVIDVREAIWFLHHCIGVLMYYPNVEELEDVVICDPQIVFDSITELILNTFKFEAVRKAACDKFKQAGQFSFNDIKKLSKTLKSGILPLPQLVKLLEYLYIIARISCSEESGAASTEAPQLASVADVRDENVVYFMPAVLPSAGESELKVSHSPVDPAPLLIRFKSGIVPFGLFCASIASLVARKKLGWTLMEPLRSGSYTLYKNRVTFRVHIQGVSYDIILISKPKRYEVHITLIRSPSAQPSHEICKHVLETVCQTFDRVISKMRHKQNLALSPSNSPTVSPYELGFQCPLHSDEDHMAVCRTQSGVMDSSLSTTHLLFEYSKNNSNLFCLKENFVVDRAALTGTLNPSSNPGDSSSVLKDYITPHVQGGHIDEKYSLWMGPSNVADSASSFVNSDGERRSRPFEVIDERKDWPTLCGYLYKLKRTQIELLGGVLGLDPFKLQHMQSLPDDMLRAWLLKQDNVLDRCGKQLSWNVLVEALVEIGQKGIADQISKDKCTKATT